MAVNRRGFFGSLFGGFGAGVIYKLQPPRRPVRSLAQVAKEMELDYPCFEVVEFPRDGTVVMRSRSWSPVWVVRADGPMVVLPESFVRTWEYDRETMIGSAEPISWDEVHRLHCAGATILLNNRPWVGPTPTYLSSDDCYACDARDGARVRELIKNHELPLRRPWRMETWNPGAVTYEAWIAS